MNTSAAGDATGGTAEGWHERLAVMTQVWAMADPDAQVMLAREALSRARHVVAAQAEMLAAQMENGVMPSFDGPDALRLLAMLLQQEPAQAARDARH